MVDSRPRFMPVSRSSSRREIPRPARAPRQGLPIAAPRALEPGGELIVGAVHIGFVG